MKIIEFDTKKLPLKYILNLYKKYQHYPSNAFDVLYDICNWAKLQKINTETGFYEMPIKNLGYMYTNFIKDRPADYLKNLITELVNMNYINVDSSKKVIQIISNPWQKK